MVIDVSIFKDYDIRGTYPNQLNGKAATMLANAIVKVLAPKTIAVCRDMRLSGEELKTALFNEFVRLGVDVFDAGLTGTEIAYFIAGTRSYDLVIMISASHNPKEYNGLKIVRKGPVAINGANGLNEIRDVLYKQPLPAADKKGTVTSIDVYREWKEKVRSLVDPQTLKPLSVVVDGGNGMGGFLSAKVFEGLPMHVNQIYEEPDGNFPHHVPNPLVESNNKDLIAKINELKADIGIAFDGDADRLFLIDDLGRFVSGTIITALLSRYILQKHPKEKILYSAVCGRIVPETIAKYGGWSMRVRVGHSFMKQSMKQYGAIFAGEHSGHFYHRDFFNSESGVLTALMILSLLSQDGRTLSTIVDELNKYPASSEINFVVPNIPLIMSCLKEINKEAKSIDELDGLSVWYPNYWFNIRASKTEPLIRLNVEADTKELLDQKTSEIMAKIKSFGGKVK
jgi:phosphomannomutase